MKGEKLLVTMKDIRRYKVLKDVIDKKLRGTEAAQLLNLTTVHISRLRQDMGLNLDIGQMLQKKQMA